MAEHKLQRRLERDALPASWLAERLGIQPARLDAMRRAGELIAVRPSGSREHLFPLWQFDEDWRPRPVVRQLAQTARAKGMNDLRLYEVLNARVGLRGERRVADLLREGRDDQVIAAVRSARP
jgi:hypothetical protein